MKKVFVISGRRWFEKTNGNTYFSCVVEKQNDDGEFKTLFEIPFEYGYGDMYEQRAIEKLFELGEVEKIDNGNGFWSIDKNKYVFKSSVVDVNRKKDL